MLLQGNGVKLKLHPMDPGLRDSLLHVHDHHKTIVLGQDSVCGPHFNVLKMSDWRGLAGVWIKIEVYQQFMPKITLRL